MACRPTWRGRAALLGGFTGLLPIGWIVLNIIFLHQLTEQNGNRRAAGLALGHHRGPAHQLLLIAFCFGAFFEARGGLRHAVAVTAAILIDLGFSRWRLIGALSPIANTPRPWPSAL